MKQIEVLRALKLLSMALQTPPPSSEALLQKTSLLVRVRLPKFLMPPPRPSGVVELLSRTLVLMRVRMPRFWMPPPSVYGTAVSAPPGGRAARLADRAPGERVRLRPLTVMDVAIDDAGGARIYAVDDAGSLAVIHLAVGDGQRVG